MLGINACSSSVGGVVDTSIVVTFEFPVQYMYLPTCNNLSHAKEANVKFLEIEGGEAVVSIIVTFSPLDPTNTFVPERRSLEGLESGI